MHQWHAYSHRQTGLHGLCVGYIYGALRSEGSAGAVCCAVQLSCGQTVDFWPLVPTSINLESSVVLPQLLLNFLTAVSGSPPTALIQLSYYTAYMMSTDKVLECNEM